MESGFVIAGFVLKGSTKLKSCGFDRDRRRFRVFKEQKRTATVTSLVCFSPLTAFVAPRRLITFVSVLVTIVATIFGLVARRMRKKLNRDANLLISESSQSDDGRRALAATIQLKNKISDEILEDKNMLNKVLLETQDKAKSADLKVQVLKEDLQLKQKELDSVRYETTPCLPFCYSYNVHLQRIQRITTFPEGYELREETKRSIPPKLRKNVQPGFSGNWRFTTLQSLMERVFSTCLLKTRRSGKSSLPGETEFLLFVPDLMLCMK
ncbi:hypothetical protein NDN08_002654 [Rhodosorus marinus]|uniref:Uncharacterized protein n=1 Tax=Rhodosorus marinus TaxID=101924 RepID=A0AAV8UVS5_9RHOD|nr:hypothetical protein NDN08_002654 [Rhodosorus marinus]